MFIGKLISETQCDICDCKIRLTPQAKYDLEKAGWSVYCSKCADKMGLNKFQAKLKEIKIYKV